MESVAKDDDDDKNKTTKSTAVASLNMGDDNNDEESSESEDASDDDDDEEEGISEYELLRLERIKRNEARLKELGLLDHANERKKKLLEAQKKRKRKQPPTKNGTTTPTVATREQPKRSKKRIQEEEKEMQETKTTQGKKKVTGSTKNKKVVTKRRCGECEGCLLEIAVAEDCNACINCVERLRPQGNRRRRCIFKQCRNRRQNNYNQNHQQEKEDQQEKIAPLDTGTTTATTTTTIDVETTTQQQQEQPQHDREQPSQPPEMKCEDSPQKHDQEQPPQPPEMKCEDSPQKIPSNTEEKTVADINATKNASSVAKEVTTPPLATTSSSPETTPPTAQEHERQEQKEVQLQSQPQEEDEEELTLPLPTSCDVCQQETPSHFLVGCSNCGKGYHSNCHVPKIRQYPEKDDKWLCMDCHPKSTKQLALLTEEESGNFALGKGWLWATTFSTTGITPPPPQPSRKSKRKSKSSFSTRKKQKKYQQEQQELPPPLLHNQLVRVKVLEPSPLCMVCSGMCKTSNPFLIDESNMSSLSIQCKACDEYYHWGCHENQNQKVDTENENDAGIVAVDAEENKEEESGTVATDKTIPSFPNGKRLAYWKCRTCIAGNKELLPHHHPDTKKKREPKKKVKQQPDDDDDDDPLSKLKLFLGEHDDDCYICINGGDLVCCDFCPKVFHLGCHIPALPACPTGIWKCCECYAIDLQNKGDGKMTRCGECSACMVKPCGECNTCKEKELSPNQNTGSTAEEKDCENKPECPHRSYAPTYVPGKIPGELFTQQEIDELQQKKKMKSSKSKKRKKRSILEETETKGDVRYFDPNADDEDNENNDDDDLGLILKLPLPKLIDPESVKIRKIIQTALKAPKDNKVQDKACEHLRKLVMSPPSSSSCSNCSCCDKIILAGGIEMISNAMSQHPDKSILQAEASATIAELVWAKPQLAIKLAHMGVVQNIISGMEEFPTNSKVQQMGCSAFRSLSYEGSNIVVINNAYGITATLNSIKRNPRKLAVQKEACIFLQNMFVQSPDIVAKKIIAADVMDILLVSLRNENADGDLRATILNVILNLTIDETSQKTICENETIIAAIITELQRQNNIVSVRQTACDALHNIAVFNDSKNKYKVSDEGRVLGALADATKAFPENASLVNSAFSLLSALINDNRPKDIEIASNFITKHEGKRLLLAAMKEHINTTTVQIVACEVISYLPFALTSGNNSEDTKSDDVDVQLAEAILCGMKAHPDSEAVQSSCVEALLEVVTHVDAACKHLKRPESHLLLEHAKNAVDDEATTMDVDDIVKLSEGGIVRRRRKAPGE